MSLPLPWIEYLSIGSAVSSLQMIGADSLIVMLSLPFSLVVGLWLMDWMGFNMSVATAVSFITLAGVAS